MKRDSPEKNCPPAVSATEGRCTALRAGANPTYETPPAAGKHFSRLPDNTGNNSRCDDPGATPAPVIGGSRPPDNDDELVWAWPKRGGEVRATLSLYKGRRFLNVRWWADRSGQFVATKEGVTLPVDAIEDFGQALTDLTASRRSGGA